LAGMPRARSACPLAYHGGLLEYLKRRTTQTNTSCISCHHAGQLQVHQYNVFLKKLVQKNRIANVAFLSLTNENGYAAWHDRGAQRAQVNDRFRVMEDVKNALAVLARDKAGAMKVFETQWEKIKVIFSEKRGKGLYNALEDVANKLAAIPLRHKLSEPRSFHFLGKFRPQRVFFMSGLVEPLRNGTSSRNARTCWNGSPIAITTLKKAFTRRTLTSGKTSSSGSSWRFKGAMKEDKEILSGSGLYEFELVDMDRIIEYGKNFFDVRFTGEAILVVGCSSRTF